MLPSTGYFKSISCPFYDNGSCERPYCHFKHLRRDDGSSSTASAGGINSNLQTTERNQTRETSTSISATNSEIIQQLVSEAVSKVLATQNVSNKEEVSENIVSKVVEGLKPTLSSTIGKHVGVPQLISKPPCVYNPTPISELKKRHIAVPVYNPTRESKVAVKRKSDDSAKPWLSSLPESIKTKSELTYKPTTISNSNDKTSIDSYVPTVKFDASNVYEPSINSGDASKKKEAYYPKVKKRREEYVPKAIKLPLKSVQELENITADDSKSDCVEDNTNLYEIEAKFSDDEDDGVTNSTKEVQNFNDKASEDIQVQEENKSEKCEKDSENVKTDLLRETSVNKEEISEEDKSKHDKTKKEHGSRRSSSSSHSSRHRSRDKEKNDHSKKDDSHRKSSKSSDRSRSSSKSHKSHHHESSRHSSSSKSRDKSRSHRDKSSSSKENDRSHHHKSSKHEKHESSRSSKSDKKKSSSKNVDKDHSHSSHASGETKKTALEDSDHDDRSNSGFEHGFINEDELLETSDSEHDVEEECLKIFQEYQVSDHPKGVTTKSETVKPETEEVEEVGKKRVAHPLAATSVVRTLGPSQPFKKLPNPQQRMYERWRLMRQATAEKTIGVTSSRLSTRADKEVDQSCVGELNQTSSRDLKSQINGNGRIRIAPVPYAKSLEIAKKKVMEAVAKVPEPKTIAQTTKSGPRVAHVPQAVPQLVRPEPLQVATQKFPMNVRQYYVNLMHDICIQIYTSSDDAAERALREELACHERCKALTVYKNSCMLAAHRLRKEVDQGSSNDSLPSGSGVISHDVVLTGKTKGSWSVVKSKKVTADFKGTALYNMLKKWILTEQQLRDNGYPRPHPDGPKGRAKIYTVCQRNQSRLSKVPNERICTRCGQSYMVNKHGVAVDQQNCIYHWGRKFTFRGEQKYSCCQQYGSATGCADAKNHVWDYVDIENLRGYVKTLPRDITPEQQGVFALDCEMSYTTQGLELTRVTVIDEDCKVIYETLVKPENTIIDYNTRFSGITEGDLEGVKTTLLDVQATLLTMFSENTILIGHSLESDFKALKLIHNTVVDTTNVFPHKNGFPHKRALKNLCSEYLRKIIQNEVGGHDSSEDAIACMELIHWKVKEEAKLQ
ncbi:RNA exonuclease 1 homolog isoform X2 [Chelonus insularis]|uniref:RNA exonuclease 1 homolog isoform X2 n=1 Tax=Chelonus insularis TaxID=460826 RepID=UPI00158F2E02|nr:RNA exonuclease 1 homolog isoform X2 [Chelonus insularis]